jgi:hypothetical protein
MRRRSVRKTQRAGGGLEAASLTRCRGTWLEHEPDAEEVQRVAAAVQQLRTQRRLALEFYNKRQEADAFSIELFREAAFNPLHLADAVVERIIAGIGEPPVVEGEDTSAFTEYLQRAVFLFGLPNPRRMLAAQLRRFLPQYVEAERWREAIAIDHNAFRTALGNEVTPFLAQMTLAGLADYYEQVSEESEE